MIRRGLSAALVLMALSGFALAETYRGVIVVLTDSKLTILARVPGEDKPQRKVLALADEVSIHHGIGDREKLITIEAVRKSIGNSKDTSRRGPGAHGMGARVFTNDAGRVRTIKLGEGGLPDQAIPVIDKADGVELYALNPNPEPMAAKSPRATFFRGQFVLEKTLVKDDTTQDQVLNAVEVCVGRGKVGPRFDPRHGLRVTGGDKQFDAVICFESRQVHFYFDPKKNDRTAASISSGVQPIFDKILKAALERPKRKP